VIVAADVVIIMMDRADMGTGMAGGMVVVMDMDMVMEDGSLEEVRYIIKKVSLCKKSSPFLLTS
jgi:hypothetical protein